MRSVQSAMDGRPVADLQPQIGLVEHEHRSRAPLIRRRLQRGEERSYANQQSTDPGDHCRTDVGRDEMVPTIAEKSKIETFTEIVGTSAKNSFCSTFALAFRSLSRRSMAVETIAFHARAGLTPSRDPPVHPRYLVAARVLLLMRTGWLRQEEIDVCQRQCASRKQADGSRAAW